MDSSTPRVIGLGGYKEHGKDAFADGLRGDWVKIGMSDKLLEVALTLDPMVNTNEAPDKWVRMSELYQSLGQDYTKIKACSPEVRRTLIRIGTEVGRDMIDENLWVKMTGARVSSLMEEGHNVAITGIRFPNELDFVKEYGGSLIWVERTGMPAPLDHPSEVSLNSSMFDIIIKNNSTLEELQNKALNVEEILEDEE